MPEPLRPGTFEITPDRVVISYDQQLIARPRAMIATFAHELAHYHMATIHAGVPGGNELHELATDLTVAYCGFGVFMDTAFEFEQHQSGGQGHGWSSRRPGYLSREAWAFAIALFLTLTDRTGAAAGHLPEHAAALKKAEAYLAKRPTLLEPLRSIG